jgi:hypothetical protein
VLSSLWDETSSLIASCSFGVSGASDEAPGAEALVGAAAAAAFGASRAILEALNDSHPALHRAATDAGVGVAIEPPPEGGGGAGGQLLVTLVVAARPAARGLGAASGFDARAVALGSADAAVAVTSTALSESSAAASGQPPPLLAVALANAAAAEYQVAGARVLLLPAASSAQSHCMEPANAEALAAAAAATGAFALAEVRLAPPADGAGLGDLAAVVRHAAPAMCCGSGGSDLLRNLAPVVSVVPAWDLRFASQADPSAPTDAAAADLVTFPCALSEVHRRGLELVAAAAGGDTGLASLCSQRYMLEVILTPLGTAAAAAVPYTGPITGAEEGADPAAAAATSNLASATVGSLLDAAGAPTDARPFVSGGTFPLLVLAGVEEEEALAAGAGADLGGASLVNAGSLASLGGGAGGAAAEDDDADLADALALVEKLDAIKSALASPAAASFAGLVLLSPAIPEDAIQQLMQVRALAAAAEAEGAPEALAAGAPSIRNQTAKTDVDGVASSAIPFSLALVAPALGAALAPFSHLLLVTGDTAAAAVDFCPPGFVPLNLLAPASAADGDTGEPTNLAALVRSSLGDAADAIAAGGTYGDAMSGSAEDTASGAAGGFIGVAPRFVFLAGRRLGLEDGDMLPLMDASIVIAHGPEAEVDGEYGVSVLPFPQVAGPEGYSAQFVDITIAASGITVADLMAAAADGGEGASGTESGEAAGGAEGMEGAAAMAPGSDDGALVSDLARALRIPVRIGLFTTTQADAQAALSAAGATLIVMDHANASSALSQSPPSSPLRGRLEAGARRRKLSKEGSAGGMGSAAFPVESHIDADGSGNLGLSDMAAGGGVAAENGTEPLPTVTIGESDPSASDSEETFGKKAESPGGRRASLMPDGRPIGGYLGSALARGQRLTPYERQRFELLDALADAASENQELKTANSRLMRQVSIFLALRQTGAGTDPTGDDDPPPELGLPDSMASRTNAAATFAAAEKEKRYREMVETITSENDAVAVEQQRMDAQAAELRAKAEDKEARLAQMVSGFAQLKQEIGRASVNSFTGLHIPGDVLQRLEEQENLRDEDVARVQLKHIHTTSQLAKVEEKIKKREQVAEGLSAIDFEQLRIENATLNEKIEARQEEITRLRKKTTTAVQILTHVREKLHFVQADVARLRSELASIDVEISSQRATMALSKSARETSRRDNENFRFAAGPFRTSDRLAIDFERRKRDIARLRATIQENKTKYDEMLQRKAIAQSQYLTLASTLGFGVGVQPGGYGFGATDRDNRITTALRSSRGAAK